MNEKGMDEETIIERLYKERVHKPMSEQVHVTFCDAIECEHNKESVYFNDRICIKTHNVVNRDHNCVSVSEKKEW